MGNVCWIDLSFISVVWLDTTRYCGTNVLGETEVNMKIVVIAGSKQGYNIRAAVGVFGVRVSNNFRRSGFVVLSNEEW